MPTCKGCGADIIFARTDRGALMPLDAAQTKIATVRSVGTEREVGQIVVGHVPHHITCPQADEFRRNRSQQTSLIGQDDPRIAAALAKQGGMK